MEPRLYSHNCSHSQPMDCWIQATQVTRELVLLWLLSKKPCYAADNHTDDNRYEHRSGNTDNDVHHDICSTKITPQVNIAFIKLLTRNRTSLQGSKYKRQVGWFLRLDYAPRSECPQFGMPAERRAQFRVLNVPSTRISERAPFWIYEHAQCGVFECTCLQRVYVTLPAANVFIYLFIMCIKHHDRCVMWQWCNCENTCTIKTN